MDIRRDSRVGSLSSKLVRQTSYVANKTKTTMRRVSTQNLEEAERQYCTNQQIIQLGSQQWHTSYLENDEAEELEAVAHDSLIHSIRSGTLLINGKSFLESAQYRQSISEDHSNQEEILNNHALDFLKKELFMNHRLLIEKHLKQLCKHVHLHQCDLFNQISTSDITLKIKTKKIFNLYQQDDSLFLEVLYYDIDINDLAFSSTDRDDTKHYGKIMLPSLAFATFIFYNPYENSQQENEETDSPKDEIDLNSSRHDLYVGFHLSHLDFSDEGIEQLFLRPDTFQVNQINPRELLSQEHDELDKLIGSQTLSTRHRALGQRIIFSCRYFYPQQKNVEINLALIPTLVRRLLENKKDTSALAGLIMIKNQLSSLPQFIEFTQQLNSLIQECHYFNSLYHYETMLNNSYIDEKILEPFKTILTNVVIESQKVGISCAKRNLLTKILKKSQTMLFHLMDPCHLPSEKLLQAYSKLGSKVGSRRWGKIIAHSILIAVCITIISGAIAATALTCGGALPLSIAGSMAITMLVLAPSATLVSSLTLVPLICSGLMLFHAAKRRPSSLLNNNMKNISNTYKMNTVSKIK